MVFAFQKANFVDIQDIADFGDIGLCSKERRVV